MWNLPWQNFDQRGWRLFGSDFRSKEKVFIHTCVRIWNEGFVVKLSSERKSDTHRYLWECEVNWISENFGTTGDIPVHTLHTGSHTLHTLAKTTLSSHKRRHRQSTPSFLGRSRALPPERSRKPMSILVRTILQILQKAFVRSDLEISLACSFRS